jgi:hypothetical protein
MRRAQGQGAAASYPTSEPDSLAPPKVFRKNFGQLICRPLLSAPIGGVNTLRAAIRPGLTAGALSISTAWFPMGAESAMFIRPRPFVFIGERLDWLRTSILASLITGWWLLR